MPPRQPTTEDFGRAVRRLRTERELTIDELAERAGIHPTYLSRIERNVNNPTWEKVGALSRAFGMTTADLARAAEDEARRRARRKS